MRLCLSLAPDSMQEAMKKLRAVPEGVDLVEIRTDGIADYDIERLLRKPRLPVIITNRRVEEGGKYAGTALEQVRILTEAIAAGAEYIDIEMSWGTEAVRRMLSLRGKSKIIVSSHNFNKTSEDLVSAYRR